MISLLLISQGSVDSGAVVAPDAPTGLNATALGATNVRVTWNPSVGATNYILERKVTGQLDATYVQVYSGMATGATISGHTATTGYTYRVLASNAGGDSPYSTVATVTTLAFDASVVDNRGRMLLLLHR